MVNPDKLPNTLHSILIGIMLGDGFLYRSELPLILGLK